VTPVFHTYFLMFCRLWERTADNRDWYIGSLWNR